MANALTRPIPEKTVTFEVIEGGSSSFYNSKDDLAIIFKELDISVANPQTLFATVPFRNGDVDITDFFGDVKFSDRTITMSFIIPIGPKGWDVYSDVAGKLSGKRAKIRFSADYISNVNPALREYWYYDGRLAVDAAKIENGMFNFDVVARVRPYKMIDRSVTYTVNDSRVTATLSADYMKGIPTFTAIGNDIAIESINGSSTRIVISKDSTGGVRVPSIYIGSGNTTLEFAKAFPETQTGNASVKVDYQLGRL